MPRAAIEKFSTLISIAVSNNWACRFWVDAWEKENWSVSDAAAIDCWNFSFFIRCWICFRVNFGSVGLSVVSSFSGSATGSVSSSSVDLSSSAATNFFKSLLEIFFFVVFVVVGSGIDVDSCWTTGGVGSDSTTGGGRGCSEAPPFCLFLFFFLSSSESLHSIGAKIKYLFEKIWEENSK